MWYTVCPPPPNGCKLCSWLAIWSTLVLELCYVHNLTHIHRTVLLHYPLISYTLRLRSNFSLVDTKACIRNPVSSLDLRLGIKPPFDEKIKMSIVTQLKLALTAPFKKKKCYNASLSVNKGVFMWTPSTDEKLIIEKKAALIYHTVNSEQSTGSDKFAPVHDYSWTYFASMHKRVISFLSRQHLENIFH